MKRAPLFALAIGVAALLLELALGLGGIRVMPSYLAIWLFALALPVGALAVVLGCELAGVTEWPILDALRSILILLPLEALLVVPILFAQGGLYDWHDAHRGSLAPFWFTHLFFTVRSLLFLLIWVGFAVLFMRPPRAPGRRALAGFGLVLHLVIGTLAALDWAMLVDPGLDSSDFGLTLLTAWAGAGFAAALLLAAILRPALLRPGRPAATLMLVLLGAWAFLHFTQFLVVWSANQPREITWYQHRTGGLGGAALWLSFTALLVSLVFLLTPRLAERPTVLASVAGMILFTHLVEMFWLITPAFRRHFTIAWPDVIAAVGLCGLAAALLAFRQPGAIREVRHGVS